MEMLRSRKMFLRASCTLSPIEFWGDSSSNTLSCTTIGGGTITSRNRCRCPLPWHSIAALNGVLGYRTCSNDAQAKRSFREMWVMEMWNSIRGNWTTIDNMGPVYLRSQNELQDIVLELQPRNVIGLCMIGVKRADLKGSD
jgi:hypothetical protein